MELNFLVAIPVLLISLLIPCGLLCIVEYFLARMESPWPGRVLPILSGAFSVLIFLVAVSQIVVFGDLADGGSGMRTLLAAVAVLLVFNIPTALFIVVYRVTRKKQMEKKDMERMNIQDLE